MRLNKNAQKFLTEWIMSQEDRYEVLTDDLAKFICELVLDTPSQEDISERLANELDIFFHERTAEFLQELSQCLRLQTYYPRDRPLTQAQQLAVQKRTLRSAALNGDSNCSRDFKLSAERAFKAPRLGNQNGSTSCSSGISEPSYIHQPFRGTEHGPLPLNPSDVNTLFALPAAFATPSDPYGSYALPTEDIVARIRAAQASEACELFSKTGICLLGQSCPYRHQSANIVDDAMSAQPNGYEHDPESTAQRYARAKQRHKEHDRRRADLQLEILNVDADRMSMLARLASKARAGPSASASDSSDGLSVEDLRAKLAGLRAEAVSLGLNEDGSRPKPRQQQQRLPRLRYSLPAPVGNTSVSTITTGSPAARYRYSRVSPYAAIYATAPRPASSVIRVDHRPKTVAITLTEPDQTFANDATSAALRAFLREADPRAALAVPPAPDSPHRRLAAFEARHLGERLGDLVARCGGRVPGLGRVELAWTDAAEDAHARMVGVGVTGRRDGDSEVDSDSDSDSEVE